MSFLFPLFLLALGALAVPVLIHLTQRERKSVVEFPSLMFLRKIPYESVQRRRIRDALLLMLRLAALALIVAAFARPFLRGSELAAAPGGARDIVVLLDRSYSMGYGDTWARAQRAAAAAIESATPADRISLVLFADVAEVALRSTPDRGRAVGEINAATPGPGSTKFGPALKLAGSLLAESLLPRKEVIVVSDFQRGGWLPDDTLRMPGGTVITPVAVEPGQGLNLAVTPVALLRTREGGQERVTVTAGVLNRTATAASNVPIHLEVDGRPVQDLTISAAPNASASVTFAPLSITNANTKSLGASRHGGTGAGRRARARQRLSLRGHARGAGAGDGGVAGPRRCEPVSVSRAGDRRSAALRFVAAVAGGPGRRRDEPRAARSSSTMCRWAMPPRPSW